GAAITGPLTGWPGKTVGRVDARGIGAEIQTGLSCGPYSIRAHPIKTRGARASGCRRTTSDSGRSGLRAGLPDAGDMANGSRPVDGSGPDGAGRTGDWARAARNAFLPRNRITAERRYFGRQQSICHGSSAATRLVERPFSAGSVGVQCAKL